MLLLIVAECTPLDVQCDLSSQVTFYCVLVDLITKAGKLVFSQFVCPTCGINANFGKDLLGRRITDAKDVL
jgi:hypothetical protein